MGERGCHGGADGSASARGCGKRNQQRGGDRSGVVQRPRGDYHDRVGRKAAAIQQPEQGLFSGIRLHQARFARLLLPHGGLHFAVSPGPRAGVATLSGRN